MNLKPKKLDYIWVRRALMLMVLDFISIVFAYFIALWIRFEFSFDSIPVEYFDGFLHSVWIWAIISLVVFYGFSLYHSIWRFVSVYEFFRIMEAYGVIAIFNLLYVFVTKLDMPRSYYAIGIVTSFICTTGLRFGYRFIRQFNFQEIFGSKTIPIDRVLVIGAGTAGKAVIKEYMSNTRLSAKIYGVIDDNENKIGRLLDGIPIIGDREKIAEAVSSYEINKIIYAIPDALGQDKKEILTICNETGCDIQIVPGVSQLITGDVVATKMRKIEIHDLLGRDPVAVSMDDIDEFISGKVVMVTGGGGSIGSELCRQIAKASPKLLIIFDIYENNAYDIQNELKNKYKELNFVTLIGSVRNTARLDFVLGEYRPEIVFHAAAHKHVPLMEDSPNEAIKNNVFGTYKMAQAAVKYGVKRFVLISTDKAVNPTNIMGASKRLCEMVVQMMDRNSDTEFVAVRFGNVLGSNGSVIPLFRKQIENGGPVTVTHPDIIRYFMTIPEAVSLVLQAGFYAEGGEIFVLDMGQPVKIADMARNLIRLSGFEPDKDIQIVYTGLRPGEKLYEELLMKEEGLTATTNKLIFIGKPIEMDDSKFLKQLKRLEEAYKVEASNMKEIVADIVPTYKPDNTCDKE